MDVYAGIVNDDRKKYYLSNMSFLLNVVFKQTTNVNFTLTVFVYITDFLK